MNALVLGSKILGFFMEFEDLLDSNLNLATLLLRFFGIPMLLYGKLGKFARLIFRQIFD